MKILLIYFSGSYNTLYLTTLLKNCLIKLNHQVETSFLDEKTKINSLNTYDIIGVGYPIYFNNTPKMFLNNFKKLKIKNKKIFIYKNGSNAKMNDSNYSSNKLIKEIKLNNEFLNEYHFLMPPTINSKLEDCYINSLINYNIKYINYICKHILENKTNKTTINGKINTLFGKIKYEFYLLNSNYIKINKKKCLKCRKCSYNCPMNNIAYNKVKKENYVTKKCVLCLRCLNNCPSKALNKGLSNKIAIKNKYNFYKIVAENKNIIYSPYKTYFDMIDDLYVTNIH